MFYNLTIFFTWKYFLSTIRNLRDVILGLKFIYMVIMTNNKSNYLLMVTKDYISKPQINRIFNKSYVVYFTIHFYLSYRRK